MDEERLAELESRLTFTDDSVEELNQALADQQKRIDGLEQLCHELIARIKSLDESGQSGEGDERPPHY